MITDNDVESYVQNVSLSAGALARSGVWSVMVGMQRETERIGGENGGSSVETDGVVESERDLRRAT